MLKDFLRCLRKVLKHQQKETREFLARHKEVWYYENFQMIAPAHYEKFLELLRADGDNIEEFVSDILTRSERQLFFENLSNDSLESLLLTTPELFQYVSDERVKEILTTARFSFFENIWGEFYLNDKIRFITLILSTTKLSKFCEGIFSDDYGYGNMLRIFKFMKELNENSSCAKVEDEIYFLMSISLSSDIIARFLELDSDGMVTEKIVTKLAENDRLVQTFEKIRSEYKVEILSKFDFMMLKQLKKCGHDVTKDLQKEELLQLYKELKQQNVIFLLNLESIIACYCAVETAEKKYILKDIFLGYETTGGYNEFYFMLPKSQKLEMLEVMLEIYKESENKKHVKSIIEGMLVEPDGYLEEFVLENLKSK